MICESCRSEIEPVMVICPSCGSRVAPKGDAVDWRQQVRETVQRHQQRKQLEQNERDERARQLSIFPETRAEGDQERERRERRAEIRARVEERIRTRTPARASRPPLDAGEVSLSRGGAAAAVATRSSRALSEHERPEPRSARSRRLEERPFSESDAELESSSELESDPESEPELDLDLDRDLDSEPGLDEESPLLPGSSPDRDVRLATPFERVLSGLIDVAFVALIQLTLFYLTTHLVSQRLGSLPTNAVAAMSLVGVVMGAGYFLFFWSLSGQTLGKLITGARVVAASGGALGFARAFARLAGIVIALLPLGLGLIGLWTEPGRRGWHDRFAGSKVVRST